MGTEADLEVQGSENPAYGLGKRIYGGVTAALGISCNGCGAGLGQGPPMSLDNSR